MEIALKYLGVNEQEAEGLGTQWCFHGRREGQQAEHVGLSSFSINLPSFTRPCHVSVAPVAGAAQLWSCAEPLWGSTAHPTAHLHLSKQVPPQQLFNCAASVIAAGCHKGFAATLVFK